MDENTFRSRFSSSAFVYPPIELFESPRANLPSTFLDVCEKLAGGERQAFYLWLKTALSTEQVHFAFYGGAVYGRNAADLDVLSFDTGPGFPLHFRKPSFIHLIDLRKLQGDFVRDWATFFVNTLLFPHRPHDFVCNIIERGRQFALDRPMLNGGLGQIIAYSAFKALRRGRDSFEPSEWEAVGGLKLDIRTSWCDFANMQTVPYTVKEAGNQLFVQMRSMDEAQLRPLTDAAIRKMRVREEKRAELADRFVNEVKKCRLIGTFG